MTHSKGCNVNYLVFLYVSDLSWSNHVNFICARVTTDITKTMSAFMSSNNRASHLCAIWDPYILKDKGNLVKSLHVRIQLDAGYEELLENSRERFISNYFCYSNSPMHGWCHFPTSLIISTNLLTLGFHQLRPCTMWFSIYLYFSFMSDISLKWLKHKGFSHIKYCSITLLLLCGHVLD